MATKTKKKKSLDLNKTKIEEKMGQLNEDYKSLNLQKSKLQKEIRIISEDILMKMGEYQAYKKMLEDQE